MNLFKGVNKFFTKILAYLVVHYLTDIVIKGGIRLFKSIFINKAKREAKKRAMSEVEKLTNECIREFNQNGFSLKESNLARRISHLIDKYKLF